MSKKPKLPKPITLQGEVLRSAQSVQKLGDAIAVISALVNGAMRQANETLWLDIAALHKIDLEKYDWSLQGGQIVAKPKEAPALAQAFPTSTADKLPVNAL
jgi:hypothetical protein